jgi:hypothetical protein
MWVAHCIKVHGIDPGLSLTALAYASMPAQRRQTRRLRRSGAVSVPFSNLVAPTPSDAQNTPTSPAETEVAPSSPSSPTLQTRHYNRRRALRRERSVFFVHAVLHYDRIENDLQPWYW